MHFWLKQGFPSDFPGNQPIDSTASVVTTRNRLATPRAMHAGPRRALINVSFQRLRAAVGQRSLGMSGSVW